MRKRDLYIDLGNARERAAVAEAEASMLRNLLAESRARVETLEAREWHRYAEGDRPAVAMPAPGPDPDDGYVWLTDPTGLVRERVLASDLTDG